MNYQILKILLCLSLPLLLCNCSNDETDYSMNLSETDDLIVFDPAVNYEGSHEIPLVQSDALIFKKLDGVEQKDEFIVRNVTTGENVYLDWGYRYAGIIGDELGYYQRVYRSDTLMVGLGFKDNWELGEYDLLLVRGDQYQKLDRFHFCILKNIKVDMSQKTGGVINVAADGWLDVSYNAGVDSLAFINKSTGKILETVSSTYKPDTGNEYTSVKFAYEKFPSGEYEMWITRWQYGLRQKICDFDLFQYAFVDSNPIVQAEDGNYYIQFTVSEFDESKDKYVIVDYPDEEYYFAEGYLSKTNWNPESKVYRLKLEDKNWFGAKRNGTKFNIQLTIGGIDITVTGDNKLQLSKKLF